MSRLERLTLVGWVYLAIAGCGIQGDSDQLLSEPDDSDESARPVCTVDSGCEDAQFCNGQEVCLEGECVPGVPVDCDDSIACTLDSCNDDTGSCEHQPDHGLCDDGLFCNGIEQCTEPAGCVPGVPPCEDMTLCDETADSCDPVETDLCLTDDDCDDGLYCNGDELCEDGECQAGEPPCSGNTDCDEASRVCVPRGSDGCTSAAACNDGLFCNGAESCLEGSCRPGIAPCADDGIYCNGSESCNEESASCRSSGSPCGEGQRCVEETRTCETICSSSADCDDGLFCNGAETCNGNGACEPGPAPACDDGIECTVDACDHSQDACVHTPRDSLCPGSQVCSNLEGCTRISCVSDEECDDHDCATVDLCHESRCFNERLRLCSNLGGYYYCTPGCPRCGGCYLPWLCMVSASPDCPSGYECNFDTGVCYDPDNNADLNPPTNLTVAIVDDLGTAMLEWQDNADNEDAYFVEISFEGAAGGYFAQEPLDPDAESIELESLPPCQDIWLRVRAENNAGPSAPSNAVRVRFETVAVVDLVGSSDANPGLVPGHYVLSCPSVGQAWQGATGYYDSNGNGLLDLQGGYTNVIFPRARHLNPCHFRTCSDNSDCCIGSCIYGVCWYENEYALLAGKAYANTANLVLLFKLNDAIWGQAFLALHLRVANGLVSGVYSTAGPMADDSVLALNMTDFGDGPTLYEVQGWLPPDAGAHLVGTATGAIGAAYSEGIFNLGFQVRFNVPLESE